MKDIFVSRRLKIRYRTATERLRVLEHLENCNAKFSTERGHRFAVYAHDWIGAMIFVDGIYERELIKDLFDVLARLEIDMSVASAIDIGANIGNHTIEFAKRFARVEAFEPNPHTYRLLCFNCDYLENVRCHNLGLSDSDCNLEMYENSTNYGGSSAVYQHDKSSICEISVKPLDQFSGIVRKVKLLKIDVEGMEYKVLLGARKILERDKPVVAFEQHPNDFDADRGETDSIRYLRSLGYVLFWLEKSGRFRSRLMRKLSDVFEPLLGRTEVRQVVTDTRVPCALHSMIFAIHRDDLV